MILLDHVSEVLARASQPYQAGRFVVVPTLLNYDNGAAVQAYIEGGSDRFVVSDGAGAAKIFASSGGQVSAASKLIKTIASGFGLVVDSAGALAMNISSSEKLPYSISHIAEASFATDEALRRLLRRSRTKLSFKDMVGDQLQRAAGPRKVERRPHVLGASNKNHEFDFAIPLSGDRKIVVDAVVQDANSINSAVVAHLDVRHAHQERVSQLIVYDDEIDWSRSNLALLGVGAPPVPASRLADRIHQMMH